MTQGVSKRKDLMKISKVIFHIKPIPSHPWWECKNQFGHDRQVIFYYLCNESDSLQIFKLNIKLMYFWSCLLRVYRNFLHSIKIYKKRYAELCIYAILCVSIAGRVIKDLDSNPNAVEGVFFSTERFSENYLYFK